jgi:hypothetical protein
MDLKLEYNKYGATEGVYHLRGGEVGHTHSIENDDGTFSVRYESGWYCTYKNNGIRQAAGIIRSPDGSEQIIPVGNKRDVVKFEAISWDEAKSKYPGIRAGFQP